MNTSQSIFPMNDQHKAKSEEWHYIKHWAVCRPAESAILELLHRIEALEAKDEGDTEALAARLRRPGRSQAERIASLVKRIEALETAAQPAKPNHPAKPDSSLVERVRQAQGCGNERDARAAIREVAAWLREHFLQGFDPHSAGGWAMRLEREAERHC